MRTAFTLFTLMAAIGTASANSPSPSEDIPAPEPPAPARPATEAEARPLALAVGEKQGITLKGNPTTGYVWIITKGLKSDIVGVTAELLSPEARPGQPDLCGAPIDTMVMFTGLAPGKETVELTYARPWEKPLRPAQVITVEVEVSEAK